jgi:exonuclease III
MKIITWNCNGAFRKKFESLVSIDADILVIQECEDPAESKDKKY